MVEFHVELPEFLHWQDGEVRLVGHRISLYDIASRVEEGLRAEQIALELPTLTQSQVDKVVAFSSEHRSEVSRYVAEYRSVLDRQSAENPTLVTTEQLRQRLRKQREPRRSGSA